MNGDFMMHHVPLSVLTVKLVTVFCSRMIAVQCYDVGNEFYRILNWELPHYT